MPGSVMAASSVGLARHFPVDKYLLCGKCVGMTAAPDTVRNCRGNVFDPACPSRAVLEVLAEKWALLLVHVLTEGPARTAQLRRRVGGISEKMLIQTLRRLERSGLVARRAYPEVPPRVEYSLTELGASLSGPITALDRWVERNLPEIVHAQRQFDDRVG